MFVFMPGTRIRLSYLADPDNKLHGEAGMIVDQVGFGRVRVKLDSRVKPIEIPISRVIAIDESEKPRQG